MGYMLNAGSGCCTTCRPSPCDPCVGCCLFPGIEYEGSQIYPPDDLPDAIVIGAEVLSRSYVYFVGTNWEVAPYGETGLWQLYPIGSNTPTPGPASGGTSRCLIGTYGSVEVTDQFADTYTLTNLGGPDVTLTRQSLCTWTGGGHTLDYGISNDYLWSVDGAIKDDPQSDPKGYYGGPTVTA